MSGQADRGQRADAVERLGAELLSDRQARVMRAVVSAYVGAAAPVGSATISELLATPLSSASIRNTMSELAQLGLIEKPHSSAGRVPTEFGLRLFVDHLLHPSAVASEQQRRLRHSFGEEDLQGAMRVVSQFLSENTRQLGFVLMPRLERVRLQHISLIRLAVERVMVVLVTQSGRSFQRVIEDRESGMQRDLDRIASLLNERIVGRTLAEVREAMAEEARCLRNQAGSLLARAVLLGQRALDMASGAGESMDLVVATRLALLDQPEFSDPERLRDLFSAMEDNEKLLALMERLLERDGVGVSLGDELEEPGLRHCALVSSSYGVSEDDSAAQGLVGVIGPSRMDYPRIIPLVSYCSQLVAEKFNENVPNQNSAGKEITG
ncbi:MAG: heat-inducible transcription repressor HrcA [Deltaproteobacteria bacterium]|nr:heat-inducible transcription repressor HrcA [Deltaproteobacteria bacterium]MBW2389424.1 heat-inducible transcription repressor HrcA [Deltaproteobacteria bacterium]